ncbi:hypothetical protein Patl1_33922 [Pistacia atlantica]|uniref:Uncharacterized protein n=1 Tax=Pistacia atlantica TaxID=434234 RepID=A0ACC0ZSX2_9ROSI|nr:hypothetical protein Patl1_33922 [Pistacia atlantica]
MFVAKCVYNLGNFMRWNPLRIGEGSPLIRMNHVLFLDSSVLAACLDLQWTPEEKILATVPDEKELDQVPFTLVQRWSDYLSDYLVVDMHGSKDLHTFIQAINTIFGYRCPIRSDVVKFKVSCTFLEEIKTNCGYGCPEVDRNNQSKLSDDANAGHKQLCLICFMKTRTNDFGCGHYVSCDQCAIVAIENEHDLALLQFACSFSVWPSSNSVQSSSFIRDLLQHFSFTFKCELACFFGLPPPIQFAISLWRCYFALLSVCDLLQLGPPPLCFFFVGLGPPPNWIRPPPPFAISLRRCYFALLSVCDLLQLSPPPVCFFFVSLALLQFSSV